MSEPLADQIVQELKQASELYHRLLLVVGPTGAGKTAALQDVRNRICAPLINVNLELSRRMLELTERQRVVQLPNLLRTLVCKGGEETILLDNIEILFEVRLKQDPLRLLQATSRNITVVAAWNGAIAEDSLTYAVPDHPEYRRYPLRDFLVASADNNMKNPTNLSARE